ncbi:protein-disulfide reductase DsbD [bacterium]|nr:protein-disulfide reductase DsbD [candidate division CSSED10-310 bacterium]
MKSMIFKRFGLSLTFLFLFCLTVSTHGEEIEIPKAEIQVISSHKSVTPGFEFNIFAQFNIPSNAHLTENFFSLSLQDSNILEPGMMELSPAQFDKDEFVRRGKAYIKLPVLVGEEASAETLTVRGETSYQICLEGEHSSCFPPKTTEFSFPIKIVKSPGEILANDQADQINQLLASKQEMPTLSLDQKLQTALEKGSLIAFLLVFVAGFITSLTPCVYPMIPITIGYIGARSAGGGKSRGFVLSLFYVLGLALVYSALGVFAALIGAQFGTLTQTPAILGAVALIFVVMGISMMGGFDIRLPSGFLGRIQGGGPKKGFIGAILMGMVAGLVAAPCAGPVIIVLMAFIAATASVFFGFFLMMSYSLGLGLLFIAIGTFSGLLSSLPQAGLWMDKIKKIFGIILIGAGIWVASPFLPPPLFGILLGLFAVFLGVLLGALDKIESDTRLSAKLTKALGILFFVSGIYFIIVLLPVPGRVVPNIPESGTSNLENSLSKVQWQTDMNVALDKATKENKFVIIDFTADWCAACKELEHTTFVDSRVSQKLKQMIPLRIDATKSRDPKTKEILDNFNVLGLPTIILQDPSGIEISRVTGYVAADQFLKFLSQAVTPSENDS